MAATTPVKASVHTPHQRHMVEFMLVAIALLAVIAGLGAYFYIAGPGSSLHCPTVTVATARC